VSGKKGFALVDGQGEQESEQNEQRPFRRNFLNCSIAGLTPNLSSEKRRQLAIFEKALRI
jgi:hypothetical protein